MSGLEKVLEEIEAERADIDDSSSAKDRMLDRHWNNCLDAVADIIKKHMNDDWIPVDEQLPEEKGVYLVTYHPCYWDNVGFEIRVGIDTFRGKTAWAQRKYQRVIAWRPLPEPYCPERSDGHAR